MAHDRPIEDQGLVYFMVGDRHYAIRGADVREIVRGESLHAGEDGGPDGRPDGRPAGQVGTVEVEGRPVPVFELGRLLGRTDATPGPGAAGGARGRHIAVTGANGDLTGWLVDRVARAEAHVEATIVPLPPIVGGAAGRWFDGVVRLGSTMLLLLAPRLVSPALPGPPEMAAAAAGPADQPPPAEAPADPIVVLFSAPALPRAQVSRYALSGRQVAAVVAPTPPLPVPGSAASVLGLTWWRDAAVPVLDFREPAARLAQGSRGRWIVARCGGGLRGTLVAFAIDPDMALHRPAADDRPVFDVECPPFAAGVFRIGEEAVALLAPEGLVQHSRA